ncbi:MAG: transketolase [Opitutales bacterium]|nr:transketolase [Opitutales bacterium]
MKETIWKTIANEARGVCYDMVAAANSGHLGFSLGCADAAAVLFGQFLRFLPNNPRWINRDRLVLSAGHGSPLLYTFLHLSGYPLSLEDLKRFRQSGSKATGHPEFGVTSGVETSTGPLGQGIGNAVGIALSQKKLAAECNGSEVMILDNCTVCWCGDGCLQEGVGQESIALAGLWKLDNLILIYDDNGVTLDEKISVSQQEDTRQKFEALGWRVWEVEGQDVATFATILDRCRSLQGKPNVILLKTVIGCGLSVAGTSKAHGAVGLQDGLSVKRAWGLEGKPAFFISDETRKFFTKRVAQLQKAYQVWAEKFESWSRSEPEKAMRLARKATIDADFFKKLPIGHQAISTRDCVGEMLNAYAKQVPTFVTGSADLFESVKNKIQGGGMFSSDHLSGRNLYFGIREHAMGAVLNGIAYDGFYQSSGSTFLVFSDYLKPALRVSALAQLPVWYFFSHDSIAVGEDGPTHQPIEQLSSLRAIPNVLVFRPADSDECAACFQCAHEHTSQPSVFATSRQALPYLSMLSPSEKFQGTCQGGYILKKEAGRLRCILIATGSEVSLALQTAALLGEGIRVVSMPCMELFLQQSPDVQEAVLPKSCTCRVSLEAGATQSWYRWVGLQGFAIGIDHFGESAPAGVLLKKNGFMPEACAERIRRTFGWQSACSDQAEGCSP